MKPSTYLIICFSSLSFLVVHGDHQVGDAHDKSLKAIAHSIKELAQSQREIALALRQLQPPKVCDTLHMSPQFSQNQDATSEAFSHATTITEFIQYYFDDYANNIEHIKTSTMQYINDHVLPITATAISMGYGYLYYLLRPAHIVIQSDHAWCNWKQTITLVHLSATPYHDIIQELMIDIQKKYLLEQTQPSLIIDTFVQDIKTELYNLENYKTIADYIQQCYCSKLFPYLYNLDTIEEKIARLYWLLDLFALWQTKELLPKGVL